MISPSTPRVSVLLPCRDAAHTLPECIESLRSQTEASWEALVVDDRSADDTGRILAEWANADARVRPVSPSRAGLVPALRDMCRAARASFVARMDADDIAAPERFEAQLAALDRDPSMAACGTNVAYFPRERAGQGYRRYEAWLNGLTTPEAVARDLFVECPIAHPTLLIRRHILDEVGGYRDFDGPEDYDLVLRLAAGGHRLTNVPGVVHRWRLGDGRHSERSDRYSADAFRRLKVEHLRRALEAEGRSDRPLVLWGAGSVGKGFVRSWLAAGHDAFAGLVDLDPRKIGQEIHGSPVVAPDGLTGRFAGAGGVVAASSETSLPRPYVLGAVGSPGAREDIRAALRELGATEIDDFRMVA